MQRTLGGCGPPALGAEVALAWPQQGGPACPSWAWALRAVWVTAVVRSRGQRTAVCRRLPGLFHSSSLWGWAGRRGRQVLWPVPFCPLGLMKSPPRGWGVREPLQHVGQGPQPPCPLTAPHAGPQMLASGVTPPGAGDAASLSLGVPRQRGSTARQDGWEGSQVAGAAVSVAGHALRAWVRAASVGPGLCPRRGAAAFLSAAIPPLGSGPGPPAPRGDPGACAPVTLDWPVPRAPLGGSQAAPAASRHGFPEPWRGRTGRAVPPAAPAALGSGAGSGLPQVQGSVGSASPAPPLLTPPPTRGQPHPLSLGLRPPSPAVLCPRPATPQLQPQGPAAPGPVRSCPQAFPLAASSSPDVT